MSDTGEILYAGVDLHQEPDESGDVAGPVRRLAKALTPDLSPNPRTALRDMRVTGEPRTQLDLRAGGEGLKFADETVNDPFADAQGRVLSRQFSVLRGVGDEVALLQIPDWIVNDGEQVGSMTELIPVFTGRKVRIIAPGVESPDYSVKDTLPSLWKTLGNADLDFISWRYVQDAVCGRRPPSIVFGLDASQAPQPSTAPSSALKRVFISSTGLDLKIYRERVRDTCLQLGFFPTMMEYFEAMGLGATEGSLKKLDEADIYIGIFAHRYGYIEQGNTLSVTELEFDHATKRGIPRLCFVVDPKFAWPPDAWDAENQARMTAFKQRVDTLIRGQFTTVDSLSNQVLLALQPYKS